LLVVALITTRKTDYNTSLPPAGEVTSHQRMAMYALHKQFILGVCNVSTDLIRTPLDNAIPAVNMAAWSNSCLPPWL